MPRIPTNRTGYAGYSCIGISKYSIPAMDCAPAGYERLPPRSEGTLSNHAWEDLSPVEASSERAALGALCHVDYDPFTGAYMDLQGVFSLHQPGIIEDACYGVLDIYSTGFMNPSSDLSANVKGANCCGS